MVELEHARSLLKELGLNAAPEYLDAKLEDAAHRGCCTTNKIVSMH